MLIVKRLARKLPVPVKNVLGRFYSDYKIKKARKAFQEATGGPDYLAYEELEALMRSGVYREPGKIRYDTEGLVLRAKEKMDIMRKRVPLDQVSDCLELGCMDGMVLAALVAEGKKCTGVDLEDGAFDPRAAERGVRSVKADAAHLPLQDASFDLVSSFAAFEHFPDPAACLKEAHRVLRKGGYLYVSFTPVYTSPFGRHAYRQVLIPYCHYLFKEEDLRKYARTHGLAADWPYVNGWTVTDYRKLWGQYKDKFDMLYYKEGPTGGIGAELIARYPSCFKGKTPDFSEFFVSGIELAWRKL